ncbi:MULTISPECIES: hypothetical protein [Pseudoalteromonas]|uniref:Uncharacterized protein n=1 Tax=Pseudoalteromonas amylolytica TaxID=1859457 RepID=A0A1S1MXY8_9GAMM|nr:MULTISPECIES: hypothetical protein [Pseudoalteromonas]OHU85536.1 hypothetical protein BFC16_19500 [Pseudoalteromonas sp. JW3]OHU91770.1 hypothetical protein BET10_08195 [Pseudoalteromonas amylolytica]
MAYSIGAISIQQNSSVITGTNTLFERVAKTQIGDLLYLRANEQDTILQVTEVLSDSQLRVALLDGRPFNPTSSASGLHYGLIQNFTTTTTAKLAKGIADLQSKWHLRESQLTDWFVSSEDSHSITNFLGEQTTIPTPTKIAQLAEVAMTASADLSTMAQAIADNKQSLASVEPRITQFDERYPQVMAAQQEVLNKRNEVVLAHDEVHLKAAQVAEHTAQVATTEQTVLALQGEIEQAAQQVELDKTHSQAAAELCVVAQNQTQSDAQTVNADKAVVTQLKADMNVLNDALNVAISDAQSHIANSAAQTQAHATQTHSDIASTASSAKDDVTRTAVNFSEQIAQTEQRVQGHAFKAIKACDSSVIALDEVAHIASSVSAELAEVMDAKSVSLAASEAVQLAAQTTSLDAIHSQAYASLCALSAKQLSEQNSKLNTALNRLLNNTLSTEQINELFPI